ncbi:hypothetical protein WJX79_005203 [Trebouxia sp. C0005]
MTSSSMFTRPVSATSSMLSEIEQLSEDCERKHRQHKTPLQPLLGSARCVCRLHRLAFSEQQLCIQDIVLKEVYGAEDEVTASQLVL